MTRVNVVHPNILTDQHLFAEYREITRLFSLVEKANKSLNNQEIFQKIPQDYRMGQGHVLFFYDKLEFIEKRYFALKQELTARNMQFTPKDSIIKFRQEIDKCFYHDYQPTPEALLANIHRLKEKINQRPNFYRYFGKLIHDRAYLEQLDDLLM